MRTVLPAAALVAASLLGGPASLDAQGGIPQGAARRAAAAHVAPGDRLVLKVHREPLLSDSMIVVTERGDAVFARLGAIPVARFTIGELRDSLLVRYGAFLRDPAIDVRVLRRVAVNGEVNDPDVYLVDVTATLRDVIAQAGGISPQGHTGKVAIVRGGERIPVPHWQTDATVASDLRSGDQVYVGRRSWLALNVVPAISLVGVLATVLLALR